jgi:TetR/AcrR family transcriptional regulator, regulator of autoinduction and epiphytic fitness
MPRVVPSGDTEPSAANAGEIVLDNSTVDGRSARAQRTRSAIVDALLSLLDEGREPVTAGRIADRAGISPRLIYHHFGDLESLFRAVAERQSAQIALLSRPIDATLALDARLDQLLDQRVAVLELLTPVRRAVLLHEPFSRTIQEAQRRLRAAGRIQVEQTFAPELATLPPPERAMLTNAVEGVLAWGFWNDLGVSDLPRAEARATLRTVLVALLGPLRRAVPPAPGG